MMFHKTYMHIRMLMYSRFYEGHNMLVTPSQDAEYR